MIKKDRLITIDYSPFERDEPIIVDYDLLVISSRKVKARVHGWLCYRGVTEVEFEVSNHKGLYGRRLIARYRLHHAVEKKKEYHPASVFLETGRYEHVMSDIEMMNPSACRARIKNWLRKNGATGKIKSKTEHQQRTIFFWSE